MPTSWQLNNLSLATLPIYPRERVKAANFYVDTNYRLIHEDEAILVIDKPAPLAVHPVGSYAEKNLHTLLKKDPRWEGATLRFMHRLDAETSGVILIAKNYEAARFIGKEFLAARVKKKYRALVFGSPEAVEGMMEYRLGRDTSSGFQTVRSHDPENGEEAQTKYRVLSVHEGVGAGRAVYSYLEVEPLTGRTHQIRAHLAFLGHPVVGDKIYIDLSIFQKYVVNGIDEEMLARLKLRRLALHAETLSFNHPLTYKTVEYSSPPPDFLGGIQF